MGVLKPDHAEPAQEQEESANAMRPLIRGVWAEQLENDEMLPLGGSLFSGKLTTRLELDFSAFDEELTGFTEESIKELYHAKAEKNVVDWLKEIGSDIDPYTYYLCYQIQQKMHQLLDVDPNAPRHPYERKEVYRERGRPKLSELKGKTACAERAALANYLFQKANTRAAYVSGITMNNAKSDEEYPSDHSFLVLDHPTKPGGTLIFDIARPRSQQNMPRVLETDVPFTYELLEGKSELLVGATEVLHGGRLWFGVGEPVARRKHKTIDTT